MNMATIKAIEARSVHQIQSGQVIVDLCSVAKELVENSLDAGATSIEVRFKNHGLDLIEVQDNGSGISPENYENVALKHYTSKLSSYDDLARLHTFGFRGEALSSLCALSDFRVITAQANQAPKATRLDFEHSGKLKKTQIVAGQKGTTASVEGLFKGLPVRRRELEKNIKREYGKVLNLLHAYACVSTGVRFGVRNSVGKTRNVVVFSTNGNQTTKENIANVYGAKTLLALIPLDLALKFEPSAVGRRAAGSGEMNKIAVRGHVSRPVFGEGRQTPDRQMFFVNSRPCGLPQIAKAFNEVYKSFNVSQSPFVFADFQMDTNAYDVNVSPDKRTILLHDAGALIESLKDSLTQLFESSDQTVPQSQVVGSKPGTKQRLGSLQSQIPSRPSVDDADSEPEDQEPVGSQGAGKEQSSSQDRMKSFLSGLGACESKPMSSPADPGASDVQEQPACSPPQTQDESVEDNELFVRQSTPAETLPPTQDESSQPVEEATQQHEDHSPQDSAPEPSTQVVDPLEETPNTIQNAFDRMRPRRVPAEMATITIGNKTVTSMIGSGLPKKRSVGADDAVGTTARKRRIHTPSRPSIFGKHMRDFAAPGTHVEPESEAEEDEVMEEVEGIESEVEEYEEGIEEIEDEADDGSQPYAPSEHDSDRSHEDVGGEDRNQEADNDEPSSQPGSQEMDEEEKRRHEEAEVERLIQEAENTALPQGNNIHRANKMNKGAAHRDSTVQLMSTIDGSLSKIQSQLGKLQDSLRHWENSSSHDEPETEPETAEERLSLTVSKEDFANMRIIGQFNLGFILATRSSTGDAGAGSSDAKDELFIIDQHASDEKFNFERLQAETIVQYQRLVQPKRLDLTAVEEEIVIENQEALEKNGFIVEVDESGDEPIGRRCRLLSLPLSKEVVFGVRDLEELIVLLSETPSHASRSASDVYIPRPSKVRKMFAMRACRSSIMIGKNLTVKQMKRVVTNMGTIDKPWNCPHGRPTMRHLMSLGQWNEWDEFGDSREDEEQPAEDRLDIWREYFQEVAGPEPDDESE
ncbi:ATP-binding mismatch repair protein PMS1 [Aspergillus ibericus CBS 121593]|uniref:DNA mismatch repair protein PMS1 n=1 Tax=Aspergillus ibericus CBS 121593 TaxID=1448316 RepID=A0A395GM62_9EURO|nr:DNA mismatch repair protein [Aspergillus ibericus CBS 121593]RAK96406.1 DNA mismatch repair protein [Aspergillus ibericus CBS 121593]